MDNILCSLPPSASLLPIDKYQLDYFEGIAELTTEGSHSTKCAEVFELQTDIHVTLD